MYQYLESILAPREEREARGDYRCGDTGEFDAQFPGVLKALRKATQDLNDKVPAEDKRLDAWGKVPHYEGHIEVINDRAQVFWNEYESDAFPIKK